MNSEEKYKALRKCVQKNDCDAFFSEYGILIANVVRTTLQKKTGRADPETIEDICQDVRLAFLEKDRKRLRDYDPAKGASIEGWIMLITSRITLNFIGKRDPLNVTNRNCLHFLDEFPENYQLKTGSQAETQAYIREILDAVETFPQQERLLFKLHFLEGISIDKIAKYLGKSTRSIQTCESRLRKRLKEFFSLKNDVTHQKGDLLDAQMVAAAHRLTMAERIKDFYPALSELEKIKKLSTEITNFNELQKLANNLEKIKNNLTKIENVERFETRHSLLIELRQHLETLAKSSESVLYEPLATIWSQALEHFAGVIQQEIHIQQGSATLDIKLKNAKIPVASEERQLYFEISNTGQEYASDIFVTLSADNTSAVLFCGEPRADIQIIEADIAKELAFSVVANQPTETVIRGIVTFSDRNRDSKTVPFSFPITVYKKIQEFRPIPNLYYAGSTLSQESPVYFGRKDAHNFIDQNILAGTEHNTIVCYGLRRTGKSSLLNRIARYGLSDSRLVPVFFDMQGIDDEKDFYLTLTRFVAEKLAPGASYNIDNFGSFKRFIRKAVPDTSDKIVVVLVDEFEDLQMRVEEGRISKTVFSNIRHLMQHENRLIFLFCGTHKLEEMSADYWSIFFNTAIYLRINYLSEDDTRQLIRQPVKEHLTWDDFAVDQILKITHGQPYLTQLICRTVVNDLNDEQKRNYATVNDVDRAVKKIIAQGDDNFSAHIWKESTPLERLILSAAAEEITQKQLNHISLDALSAKVHAITNRFPDRESVKILNNLGVKLRIPTRECVEILNNLVSKEILAQTDTRYHFPVNLLRKWIATRHPLRQVREEI